MTIENYPPTLLDDRTNAITRIVESQMALAKNVTYPTFSAMSKLSVGQKQLKWNADVGGTGTTIKSIVDDAVYSNTGATKPANLSIGEYAITHTFDLAKTDIVEARNTSNVSELRDLITSHVHRGLLKIFRDINGFIFSGDGSPASAGFIGLETITDNTIPYAGIDGTVHTGWQSPTYANGGVVRPLTSDLFLEMEELIMVEETNYDLIIMPPALSTKYKKLFDLSRSFNVSNGSNPADLGINTITYNGRPILQDPRCTENTIYFLDTSEISLYSYTIDGAVNLEGTQITIQELATQNTYKQKWELGVIPQMKLHNRKAVSVLKDVE